MPSVRGRWSGMTPPTRTDTETVSETAKKSNRERRPKIL